MARIIAIGVIHQGTFVEERFEDLFSTLERVNSNLSIVPTITYRIFKKGRSEVFKTVYPGIHFLHEPSDGGVRLVEDSMLFEERRGDVRGDRWRNLVLLEERADWRD